jgi:scyllo-inositol 2-dehydrogenase (NADP+)
MAREGDMSDPIRVGLVGYGMAGRVFHAPVIHAAEGLELVKVVERRTRESPKRYPGVEVVADVSELFGDDVDLVVVATPNATHHPIAREALLAGKHVVVDKPFTTTSAQADELIGLARLRGVLVTAFQNRRWDGDFLTARAVLEAGLLGRLVEYESHFDRFRGEPRPGAWREAEGEGSGLLFDLAPHLVDQALTLFGRPHAVTADVRTQRDDARADDSFALVLHYERLTATLGAGMLLRVPGPRFALHGTAGSFVKHGLDPQEEALKAGRSPLEPGWGAEPEDRWGMLDVEVGGVHVRGRVETRPGSYLRFYENVRDAIRGGTELEVAPEAARDVIRVVELALASSAERRTIPFTV